MAMSRSIRLRCVMSILRHAVRFLLNFDIYVTMNLLKFYTYLYNKYINYLVSMSRIIAINLLKFYMSSNINILIVPKTLQV